MLKGRGKMETIRVIIVDDEILAIQHIRRLLSAEQLGCEVVAEYTHARRALEELTEHKPDLIFADIKMPGMDGIEFSTKALALLPQTRIVLLTSYREFEYAKAALKLGIRSYLLKHEVNEQLLASELGQIREELRVADRKERLLRMQLLSELLHQPYLDSERRALALEYFTFPGQTVSLLLVEVDQPLALLEAEAVPVSDPRLEEGIRRGVELADAPYTFMETAAIRPGQYAVLLAGPRCNGRRELRERCLAIAASIQREGKAACGGTVSLAIAAEVEDVASLPRSFKSAQRLLAQRLFAGTHKRLLVEDGPLGTAGASAAVPVPSADEVAALLQAAAAAAAAAQRADASAPAGAAAGRGEAARRAGAGAAARAAADGAAAVAASGAAGAAPAAAPGTGAGAAAQACARSRSAAGAAGERPSALDAALEQLFAPQLAAAEPERFRQLAATLLRVLEAQRARQQLEPLTELLASGALVPQRDWMTAAQIVGWFKELCREMAEQAAGQGGYSKKVRQAMDWMREHYREDWTADSLALQLGLSGDRLRHLFKEETGRTLLDYMTELRISRAKRLLEEGTYKMYEIAELTGYKSSQYFSQVFRKATGMSPYDYAERGGRR